MCIFSQPVERVADTNIFARGLDGTQLLAYSMTYGAASDLAMVLPLPVPPHPSEDAVRFINLEEYPDFFADMRRGFPEPTPMSSDLVFLDAVETATLQVHDVGSFEASFVPQIEDFDRLDERFRVPANVWDDMPAYHDYGFAVFKLKGTEAGESAVHPMAFEFPRRNPELLFFPTVHVHDRTIHAEAEFDHLLYCQVAGRMRKYTASWERSVVVASHFLDASRTEGIVDHDQYCWRMGLKGSLTNQDTWIGNGGFLPQKVLRGP